ncbi:hypothetical protein BCR32DRAFT_152865 [Anaeromyces robustus]|uniref:Uncharacterized protein n=1 Tax=Anaeromyces robustus TaxID=1754192 RepID=A0A1Y1XBM3_9FUNG|nr:hypothetical protein BCR32DRAFT_152865 [Anaeromyces robustus]|eukprot:ORX83181.1 hypothetical protein BCR32DRAFT_152865 [Anaeromyces robustus]
MNEDYVSTNCFQNSGKISKDRKDITVPIFSIDNLIKKQKNEKDKDLIECQNLIDIIQKLQKIRNIRRSKDSKQLNISLFENNLDIKNIDDKINKLSQIISPLKVKKKKNKNKNKNKSVNNKTNDSLIQTKNQNISSTSNTLSSHFHNINNTSVFIKKKKIYHYSEKNKKLLKIKCEPYSNVYEYFNNTKLDMKSLIYIRKEWDKYIVKDGGTSIPPNFVKPDPPASIYWSQYLINENKIKK